MAEAPDLTLWGVGTSRTIRPHWAMHELGLSYKTMPIGPRTGETKTAEYTRLNPRQKVPLLQDGDFCIGESAAIVAYLSRMYSTPERSLIPETPRDYAAWLEWCFFVVAELDSTSLYVMRRHRRRRARPDLRHRTRGRRQGRRVFSRTAAPRRSRAIRRPAFLMGDKFTSADILLTTCLDWAIAYGVGICDNAHPYLERIRRERPTSSPRKPTRHWRRSRRCGQICELKRSQSDLAGGAHGVLADHLVDRTIVIAELAQHLAGVLADAGRRTADRGLLTSNRAAGFGCRTRPTIG